MKTGINSSLYDNNSKFPNEKIMNGQYYFIIPTTMASKCSFGQYYDSNK